MLNESEFTNGKCTRPGCGAEARILDNGTGIFVSCTVCTNRYLLHEYPLEPEASVVLTRIIELKSPLTGFSNGKKLDRPYRARLIQFSGDNYVTFQPGQKFADGHIGWIGGWNLKTLLEDPPDVLSIDFGQEWEVSGVADALRESLNYVTIALKEF